MTVLAGMVASADSSTDVGWLRHAAMDRACGGVRAPWRLARFFVRSHGHLRQTHSAHRTVLSEPAHRAPLLPGTDAPAFLDIDSTHRQVHGCAQQSAAAGRSTGKKTLHPLPATLSAPIAAGWSPGPAT
jgi:hypothetical protein